MTHKCYTKTRRVNHPLPFDVLIPNVELTNTEKPFFTACVVLANLAPQDNDWTTDQARYDSRSRFHRGHPKARTKSQSRTDL